MLNPDKRFGIDFYSIEGTDWCAWDGQVMRRVCRDLFLKLWYFFQHVFSIDNEFLCPCFRDCT